MKIKKGIILAAVIMTAVALVGCAGGSGDSRGDSADMIQVGIIQLIDNGAFTDMREGFIGRIRELGYGEDTLAIDYKNANGDAGTLHSICQAMVSARMDLVVTIATPPTQAFVNMESDVPVFFISVSNPVQAGVITDMAHPDKLATGTSNAIPVEEMFALAERLTPGIRTFGMIYSAGEINSVTTAENAKRHLDAIGVAYREALVTASSEVHQAVLSLVGNVDAIFVPNDSVVQNAMAQVAEAAREAGIPVYGSSNVMVASGAFATISIDDQTIGAMTADMVHEYLSGKSISDIPAVTVSDFTMVINQSTAEAIGIDLPEDILATAVLLR
jgi:putative ABC transport system substrate-binding protein